MMNEPRKTNLPPAARPEDRRGFLKRGLAVFIGTLISLVPVGAGLMVLLDPLRRSTRSGGGLIKVANLEALPDDGVPRRFQVISTKVDAWNKFAETPIGAVYLRRIKGGPVEAFNAVCPHAGCLVDFAADKSLYTCPCHKSSFNVTGRIEDRSSPAPRGLDSLVVEVRDNKEVWIKFQNFQAGRPEKVPVA
jgi:quinol---cytochrome c reductase iron-sulfur subunit, bacillus type